MRFIVRQAKAGVAIVDPDAARLASIGAACTGDARADMATLRRLRGGAAARAARATSDSAQALEAAYDKLAAPHSALTSELSS